MSAPRRGLAVAVAMLTLGAIGGPAPAQGLLNRGSGPIAIDADEGIEWRRDEKVYIATGNAKAVRGDVTVTAHRLIAYYRERDPARAAAPTSATAAKSPGAKPTGAGATAASATGASTAAPGATAKDGDSGVSNTDIYRLVAETDVTIATPTQTAKGDHGVYDVDRSVLVLTGKNLTLDTTQDHITARDSLEYWDERKIAVARGDGVMVRADRRIQGDVLTAHIEDDKKTNTSKVTEVDGFGHVRVSTPTQIATGAKGVYNLVTNMAYLVDDVRVTQAQNQLNGDYAEVNLNTNVSRILSGPSAGRPGQRVRSLIVPNQGEPPAPAAATSTPARRAAPRTGS
jgi:lipopolysaccharide export system protein LptA